MTTIKKIYWWVYVVFLSFKWCFRVNLGDTVFYKNKKYIVANGVRSNSWRLSGLSNGDSGWVKRSDCRKVLTFSNMKKSFKSGYFFYMTSWYDIWCRNGIEPWMKSCKIW